MRYFFYKSFTWITVICTALFGTFLTGFVLGAVGSAKVLEDAYKKSDTPSDS